MGNLSKLQEDHGRWLTQGEVDSLLTDKGPFRIAFFRYIKQWDIITYAMKENNPPDPKKPYKARPVIILNPSYMFDFYGNGKLVECSHVIPITSTYNGEKFKIPFEDDLKAGLKYEYKSYMNVKNYHDHIVNDAELIAANKGLMVARIGTLPEEDKKKIDDLINRWNKEAQRIKARAMLPSLPKGVKPEDLKPSWSIDNGFKR